MIDFTKALFREKTYVGFYSKKAASLVGTVLYSNPDGKTVEVTAIIEIGHEDTYNWEDKVNVGIVSEYKCRKTYGLLDSWY